MDTKKEWVNPTVYEMDVNSGFTSSTFENRSGTVPVPPNS